MTSHSSSSQKATKEDEDKPGEKRSLFSVLRARFNTKQRMLQGLLQDDVKTVARLLKQGFKVNSSVQAGDKSALHVAAQQGCLPMVELLLKAGADPLQKNSYNMSPVDVAVVHHHPKCLYLLMAAAPSLLDVEYHWQHFDGTRFLWRNAVDRVVVVLIHASPNLDAVRSCLRSNLWFLCVNNKMLQSLQAWVLTGTSVSKSDVDMLTSEGHKEFRDWYTSFRSQVQPLSHYCRLAIRRTMQGHCNVFCGVRQLPLPLALQDFLAFR